MKCCMSCFVVATIAVLFTLTAPVQAQDSPFTQLCKEFKAVAEDYEAFGGKADLDVEKHSMTQICKLMNQMRGGFEAVDKGYFSAKNLGKEEKDKFVFVTQMLLEFSEYMVTGSLPQGFTMGYMMASEYDERYKDVTKELPAEQKKEFAAIHEKAGAVCKKAAEELKKLRAAL